MANEVLIKSGTQVVFADVGGDFAPAAANDLRQGTPTTVQLALAGVADDAARQSTKVDLGATRARQYSLSAALEFAATPVAGEFVEFYWAPSGDATAANSNPAACTGADGAYSGYSSNLDASLKQLVFIGVLVVTEQPTATVQVGTDIGRFSAAERYGSLVVVNRAGAAIHSDDVECHIVCTPIVDEVQ